MLTGNLTSIAVAIMAAYKRMETMPQPASKSILLSPPTHPFGAFWQGVRLRDWYMTVVAGVAVLSIPLPVFLNTIPFHDTQTWEAHLAGAGITFCVLFLMALVLVTSFFTTWPRMPVDPTTLAGVMYYLADSPLVHELKGMESMTTKVRDGRIEDLGFQYSYGEIAGAREDGKRGILVHTVYEKSGRDSLCRDGDSY